MIEKNLQSARLYLALIFLGAILVFIAEALYSKHYPYPFEYDSATYVEMADNLRLGLGLKETASLHAYNEDLTTVREWPPGFPAMLAALSITGLSGADAARVLVGISLFLLPCAMVFALRPIIGTGPAVAVAILASSSPLVLRFGYVAMADGPFLLMVTLSLGLLFRCSLPGTPLKGLLLSGLFAGIAYALRNAGTALFSAVIATFVVAWMTGMLERREALRRAGMWVVGASVVVLPLLFRNYLAAGGLQPYTWTPAEFGFLTNLRQYMGQQLRDFGGFHELAMLPWHTTLFFTTAVPLMAALAIALVRLWPSWRPATRFGVLVMAFYCASGIAMIVTIATIYRFSDVGLPPRYSFQYTWLLFAIVAAAWTTREKRLGRFGIITAGAVLLALVAGRVSYLKEEVTVAQQAAIAYSRLADLSHGLPIEARELAQTKPWTLSQQIKHLIAADTTLVGALKLLPDEAYLVGHPGDVMRLHTKRQVRSIFVDNSPAKVWSEVAEVRQHVDAGRPMYLIFTPSEAMLRAGDWQRAMLATLPINFTLVERAPNRMIFAAVSR